MPKQRLGAVANRRVVLQEDSPNVSARHNRGLDACLTSIGKAYFVPVKWVVFLPGGVFFSQRRKWALVNRSVEYGFHGVGLLVDFL